MSPAFGKHCIRSADTFMQIWGSLACAYGCTRTHGSAWAFPLTAVTGRSLGKMAATCSNAPGNRGHTESVGTLIAFFKFS